MSLSPIVLFVYNRLWHTQLTLEALQKNEYAQESDLFIFSDGPKEKTASKAVAEVREQLRTVTGFRTITITERQENLGLANSIISGVSDVISRYERVIVLEDDLITSPYFLRYMNSALRVYKDTNMVFSISGYNHPSSLMQIPQRYHHDVYFCPRNSSWGWATWKDRWERTDWDVADFEAFRKSRRLQGMFNSAGDDLSRFLISQMEGNIDSWSIRWTYTHFKHGGVAVYPVFSYIDNIGLDSTGTHCGTETRFRNDLSKAKREIVFPEQVILNRKIMRAFRNVYKVGFIYRVKRMFKSCARMMGGR